MSRCDYDVMFCRVFCITLLGIAFTFTVILTNIFIDLDNVLFKKNVPVKPEILFNEVNEVKTLDFDDSDDENQDPLYRTRRSIELSGQENVKNSAYKKVFTKRLESLLEELDKATTTVKATVTTVEDEYVAKNEKKLELKNEDLMHLAMHNILLQGIVGHMDLYDVYKKFHNLIKSFHNNSNYNQDKYIDMLEETMTSRESRDAKYSDEHKFFKEIIKCKKLKNEIAEHQPNYRKNNTGAQIPNKGKKLLIRTVIEINGPENKYQKLNDTDKENIVGLIKLLYNGKAVKMTQLYDDQSLSNHENSINDVDKFVENVEKNEDQTMITQKPKPEVNIHEENLLNKVIEEYLDSHPSLHYKLEKNADVESFKRKRLKRQIKIRYSNEDLTKPKIHRSNNDDDDLYIEIETHFDKNGVMGEKKKKLVKSFIEKIQKALRSDNNENDKKLDLTTFKERFQVPLDEKVRNILLNTVSPSLEAIKKREVDPIDKTLEKHEFIYNKFGNTWKKVIDGPRFLSVSKSINSAEMNEVNADYDRILENGIPQRFQEPLNGDDIVENTNVTSTYDDSGKVTLFFKNIDGTGFSIGINQYMAGPPDQNSMKMFNNLDTLIKEYRQQYQDISNESGLNEVDNLVEENHQIRRRDINNLKSGSEAQIKYSSNKIPQNYSTPFQKYLSQIVYNNRQNNTKNLERTLNSFYIKNINLSKKTNSRVEKDLINRKLKSFRTVNKKWIKRNKRSVTVKKISNIKSKIKLSRYINTNAMTRKKIFLKSTRNKRQIDKIRIIARDPSHIASKNSDENLFIVSRENTYSNIKEVETPETLSENINDDIFPIDTPTSFSDNPYSPKNSQYELMSKYPHVFVYDSGNKEEIVDENVYNQNDRSYRILPRSNSKVIQTETTLNDVHEPKIDEIVNAIIPSLRSKFKVTVKIFPKNITNVDESFKEVHTSVNKTFDENGLRYFSIFNLSQLSKVEKLNKSSVELKKDAKKFRDLRDQGDQIKTLLQLHKKRVEQQLQFLLRESQQIGEIINNKNNKRKIINISQDNIKTDYSDEKINKVLESLRKLQENYILTKRPVDDISDMKSEIISTIKSNEKITYEILKKIDANTQILTAFLENISAKHKERNTPLKTEGLKIDWKFKQNNDNPVQNNSELIYSKRKTPISNSIHQEIFTNVHENTQSDLKNDKREENTPRRMVNESKFFMDEIDSEYKIVPDKDFVDLKINVTNIPKM